MEKRNNKKSTVVLLAPYFIIISKSINIQCVIYLQPNPLLLTLIEPELFKTVVLPYNNLRKKIQLAEVDRVAPTS